MLFVCLVFGARLPSCDQPLCSAPVWMPSDVVRLCFAPLLPCWSSNPGWLWGERERGEKRMMMIKEI